MDYVREIASLQREIDAVNREKLDLYSAYSDGEIKQEEYTGRSKSLNDRVWMLVHQEDELRKRNREYRQSVAVLPPAMEYLQDMAGLPQYDNELIAALVKHVVVYNEQQVEIVWKYADEVGAIMTGENGGRIWNSRS